LLRYLKRLPEPVIPFEFYDKFTSVVGQESSELPQNALAMLTEYIAEIPPVSRELLFYLMDLLQVLADCSYANQMTTPRLVAAFQPSLLAREPSIGMSAYDHRQAADTLVFMIESGFHIEVDMGSHASLP
jgi:hypothetical protein